MGGLRMIGTLLLIIGLIGIGWGIYVMYQGRDSIDVKRDAEIVFEDGDFPAIGIAGAAAAGVGILVMIGASMGGRRSRHDR